MADFDAYYATTRNRELTSGRDGSLQGNPSAEYSTSKDFFYEAWDKFLCHRPIRRLSFSKEHQEDGGGIRQSQHDFASWDQAAHECKAKVAAIVKECGLLNQKYRDGLFALDDVYYCFASLDRQLPDAAEEVDLPPRVCHAPDLTSCMVMFTANVIFI